MPTSCDEIGNLVILFILGFLENLQLVPTNKRNGVGQAFNEAFLALIELGGQVSGSPFSRNEAWQSNNSLSKSPRQKKCEKSRAKMELTKADEALMMM